MSRREVFHARRLPLAPASCLMRDGHVPMNAPMPAGVDVTAEGLVVGGRLEPEIYEIYRQWCEQARPRASWLPRKVNALAKHHAKKNLPARLIAAVHRFVAAMLRFRFARRTVPAASQQADRPKASGYEGGA